MSKTKIQWTEFSINPIVGCTKISSGCQNCFAERMAGRLANIGQKKYQAVVKPKQNHSRSYKPKWAGKWNGKTYFDEFCLQIPLKRKKPTMFFVSSMGDIFCESVQFGDIEKVMATIENCPQHTFQILTKRADIMLEYFSGVGKAFELSYLPNLWLGVTVEHPDYKNRIDILRQIPTTVKFLSIEPCLADMGELNLEGIDWIIVGGESGPGARYCELSNIHNIVDQCKKAGVKCFVKQIHGPLHQGKKFKLIKDINQFPEDLQIREYPND